MDKDQLAALDRAEQAAWEAHKANPSDPDLKGKAHESTIEFRFALVKAYRTGKLVLIEDGAVERVARAIALECDCDPDVYIAMHGKHSWDKNFCQQARAALSALGVK
jgi:hypothetical protein